MIVKTGTSVMCISGCTKNPGYVPQHSILFLFFSYELYFYVRNSRFRTCSSSSSSSSSSSGGYQRIFGYSVFLGWTGGPWGRNPFNTSDPWSGTLFLSVRHSASRSSFKSKLKSRLFSSALICCFLSSHSTNPYMYL